MARKMKVSPVTSTKSTGIKGGVPGKPTHPRMPIKGGPGARGNKGGAKFKRPAAGKLGGHY